MRDAEAFHAGFEKAIAVVTASFVEPSSTDLSHAVKMSYLDEGGIAGLVDLTTGLQNLCTWLLLQRQEEVGVPPLETLQVVSGVPADPR